MIILSHPSILNREKSNSKTTDVFLEFGSQGRCLFLSLCLNDLDLECIKLRGSLVDWRWTESGLCLGSVLQFGSLLSARAGWSARDVRTSMSKRRANDRSYWNIWGDQSRSVEGRWGDKIRSCQVMGNNSEAKRFGLHGKGRSATNGTHFFVTCSCTLHLSVLAAFQKF